MSQPLGSSIRRSAYLEPTSPPRDSPHASTQVRGTMCQRTAPRHRLPASRAHIRPRLANLPVQRPLQATTFLPTGRHHRHHALQARTNPTQVRSIVSRLTRDISRVEVPQRPRPRAHLDTTRCSRDSPPVNQLSPGTTSIQSPRHHRPPVLLGRTNP